MIFATNYYYQGCKEGTEKIKILTHNKNIASELVDHLWHKQ
jgi:hypothetical protein